jgi:transcriptional regulator with XRE-family HTH domain
MKLFREIIREARIKKGMTYRELSRLTGICVSTLNEFEKGRRRPKFLIAEADTIQISLNIDTGLFFKSFMKYKVMRASNVKINLDLIEKYYFEISEIVEEINNMNESDIELLQINLGILK